MVVVDVKKDMGNRKDDLTNVGWYMEKDVSSAPSVSIIKYLSF